MYSRPTTLCGGKSATCTPNMYYYMYQVVDTLYLHMH